MISSQSPSKWHQDTWRIWSLDEGKRDRQINVIIIRTVSSPILFQVAAVPCWWKAGMVAFSGSSYQAHRGHSKSSRNISMLKLSCWKEVPSAGRDEVDITGLPSKGVSLQAAPSLQAADSRWQLRMLTLILLLAEGYFCLPNNHRSSSGEAEWETPARLP